MSLTSRNQLRRRSFPQAFLSSTSSRQNGTSQRTQETNFPANPTLLNRKTSPTSPFFRQKSSSTSYSGCCQRTATFGLWSDSRPSVEVSTCLPATRICGNCCARKCGRSSAKVPRFWVMILGAICTSADHTPFSMEFTLLRLPTFDRATNRWATAIGIGS